MIGLVIAAVLVLAFALGAYANAADSRRGDDWRTPPFEPTSKRPLQAMRIVHRVDRTIRLDEYVDRRSPRLTSRTDGPALLPRR